MSEPIPSSSSSSPTSSTPVGNEDLNRFYISSSVDLRDLPPESITLPKFWFGQTVVWAQVPPHGFGTILGIVFANGVSVEAYGYHYLVLFSPNSPSQEYYLADWAFEEDLDFYQP